MSARFTDKVVLITGGGTGIGKATAQAFAAEGATVVVAGRNEEPLARTVKEIGAPASLVTADVSQAGDVERMVRTVVERHGRLDIAINNAGVLTGRGPVADIDTAEWAQVLDVNLTGVFLSMKYEIAQMREAGGGVIVNLSSVIGPHVRRPGAGAYAASKAGVSALTKTAAKEYISAGIRINAVSPASSDTSMSFLPGEDEAARAERMKTMLPIGRLGALDEITGTIRWLASPEAGFAVGLDLVVDGGASA
jgi:NAD(P)-dependent dehydrogenase (short-subunit alcohol dehydrogenase family)